MSDSEDSATRRLSSRGRRVQDVSAIARAASSNLRDMFLSTDQSRSREQSTGSSRDGVIVTDVEEKHEIRSRRSYLQSEQDFEGASIKQLGPTNALPVRISAALLIAEDVASQPTTTAMDAADAVEDLISPESTQKARKAALKLVEAVSSNPQLSHGERKHLFGLATRAIPASETHYQISVINRLTDHGRDAATFEDELTVYLSKAVESQYTCASEARRKARSSSERPKGLLPEERGLHQLLHFTASILQNNPNIVAKESLGRLIRGTILIAEKTTSKIDMNRAVELLLAAIRAKKIPEQELPACVEVLSAIFNAIPDLNELTWACLMLLLESDLSGRTVEILLKTLSLAPTDRHTHTVCGALSVLSQLVSPDRDPALPGVEFSQLLDALLGVHYAGRKIRRDCLRTIAKLLRDERLADDVISCRWDHLIQIILTATGDKTYDHESNAEPLTIGDQDTTPETERSYEGSEASGELAQGILQELEKIATVFTSMWLKLGPDQRHAVGLYFNKLRLVLPPKTVQELLEKLGTEKYFSVGTRDWQSHQLEIIRLFVWDYEMNPNTSCLVIKLLTGPLHEAAESDLEHFHMVVLRLVSLLETQFTDDTAAELATFTVLLWERRVPSQLGRDLERLWPLFKHNKSMETQEIELEHPKAPVHKASAQFVGLFLTYMEKDLPSASILYEFLVKSSKDEGCLPTARLSALRALTRLRCNARGEIFLVAKPDSYALADALHRLEAGSSTKEQGFHADRFSMHAQEDTLAPRPTRASGISPSSQHSSKSGPRASGLTERMSRLETSPPLWMYPNDPGLPKTPPERQAPFLLAFGGEDSKATVLKISEWLIAMIEVLQRGGQWDVYSYVLAHLPSQLSNPSLFNDAIPHIKMLRNIIVSQLLNDSFQEPPASTGVKKADVALCLFDALTMLMGYSEHFARTEQDDVVRAFLMGISGWDRTAKTCLQGLAIACHQIPASVGRALQKILLRMSQIITQSQLSVDILEFLGGLARLPSIYANFREEEYRLVFAICVRYLEHAREQRFKMRTAGDLSVDYSLNRASGLSVKSASTSESSSGSDIQKELPQYVFALAHHVITIWFLSLRMPDRPSHVGWITSNLVWTDQHHNEIMEEQSQVTLDMMHRTTYLNLGETIPNQVFQSSDRALMRKSWIVGMSMVTIETDTHTGLTQIVKRQASGTTYASYQSQTAALPPHHESSNDGQQEESVAIFPNHVFLQLTSTIAPTPTPMEPICLPDDDIVRRAISSFDRNDTVDGYKIGVIYVGPDQQDEADILANEAGSELYESFLAGLGTKVRLQGAAFNTQGLDKQGDTDGQYTYAWRDRIAEMVFHVATMMPTDRENDPHCTNKKRHIGNDFVNVIFNESGHAFRFDTIASQFNYVNIVITPESNERSKPAPPSLTGSEEAARGEHSTYVTVQTFTNASMPAISPTATYKLLTLPNLSTIVRQLSLAASVFSNVWVNRDGGEHISSWRNRLREIVKLREKYANTGTSASEKFPGAKGTKTYQPGDSFAGRVGMGGLLEEEGVLASLDFSRWAGPNPPMK